MSRVEPPLGRLLLIKHLRRPSNRLLARAAELARRLGAELTFADTLEGGDRLDEHCQEDRLRELRSLLSPHLDGLRANYRLMTGGLAEAAQEAGEDYDLIIPADGEPGSEAARKELVRLLRRSPSPVYMERGDDATPRGIVAAVDLQTPNPLKQALNLPIVRHALLLASAFDCPLDLLTVRTQPQASERLAQRLAGTDAPQELTRAETRDRLQQLLETARGEGLTTNHEPRLLVVQGEPDALIAQAAAAPSVDLLVAGCIGRSGVAAWLVGNTAERLSQDGACSVLAIKPTQQQLDEALSESTSRAA